MRLGLTHLLEVNQKSLMKNERVGCMKATIRRSIYDIDSLHRSRNETGAMTNKGIWWAKKEIDKIKATENYLSLILVRHRPGYVAVTVKTVSFFF